MPVVKIVHPSCIVDLSKIFFVLPSFMRPRNLNFEHVWCRVCAGHHAGDITTYHVLSAAQVGHGCICYDRTIRCYGYEIREKMMNAFKVWVR